MKKVLITIEVYDEYTKNTAEETFDSDDNFEDETPLDTIEYARDWLAEELKK